MRVILVAMMMFLAACASAPDNPKQAPGKVRTAPPWLSAPDTGPLSGRRAVQNFIAVVNAVEPVAERFCRETAPALNCDFRIVVDETVNAPPNAYQKLDETGRPIIAFTIPLIAEARNRDELAFIMAHEAAHHIRGHLAQQRRNARLGAVVFGGLAGAFSPEAQRAAQQIGATIGARTYSKEYELEADALGTVIAARAGFDPVRGAAFFARIPDPGNRFLGTHPANADRFRTVQRVAAGL